MRIRSIIPCSLLILGPATITPSQVVAPQKAETVGRAGPGEWPLSTATGTPFRIARNTSDEAGEGARYIYVLLDGLVFTFENVEKICSVLAREYNRPKLLDVTLYSSAEMLQRAINVATSAVPHFDGPPPDWYVEKMLKEFPSKKGYFRAHYVRTTEGDETLSFSPDPDKEGYIEVNLGNSGPYTGDPKVDLTIAASRGDIAKVRSLFAAGARENIPDDHAARALARASFFGHLEVVKVLIANGASMNGGSASESTALMQASVRHHLEIVSVLLKNGAFVNAADKFSGQSALHFAIDDVPTCQLLLDGGADINWRDARGFTPLMRATNQGSVDVVKLLLSRGANLTLRNKNGQTALGLANALQRRYIAGLLRSAGAEE